MRQPKADNPIRPRDSPGMDGTNHPKKPQLTVCISMKVCVMIGSCTLDATHLWGEPFVGAGHARDQEARGHDPLLQISTAFSRIVTIIFLLSDMPIARVRCKPE